MLVFPKRALVYVCLVRVVWCVWGGVSGGYVVRCSGVDVVPIGATRPRAALLCRSSAALARARGAFAIRHAQWKGGCLSLALMGCCQQPAAPHGGGQHGCHGWCGRGHGPCGAIGVARRNNLAGVSMGAGQGQALPTSYLLRVVVWVGVGVSGFRLRVLASLRGLLLASHKACQEGGWFLPHGRGGVERGGGARTPHRRTKYKLSWHM